MTDRELHVVMKSPINGIRGDDLRDEMIRTFRDRQHLIPDDVKDTLTGMNPAVLQTIIDLAAISAQCRIRRTRGLPEPLGKE